MDQIIPQMWQGLQCFLLGVNFITRERGFDCSELVTCGQKVSSFVNVLSLSC
jgi:hypothetical protein